MTAIEHHETRENDDTNAQARERLLGACDRAGDAAPAAERQALRSRLTRASRSGLAQALERLGI